ncbi:FAD-dependent oxidoreductase [Ruegeria halocynthiae]|uniref:oxidoreductase n=1 Tax=Ruegeria halocynthiae TaxID=985054 RepID=UPI00055AEFE8|nr:FAD-dependent oxidoreductase [Ruegeria halocynthiae]
MRDPRYDILFEPVQIGPLTAKNRFFQVPHCNGMGKAYPRTLAAMRAMKAEGGWAIVSTEEAEIHPGNDFSPMNEFRVWNEQDLPAMMRVAQGIREHGALAAVQLAHTGARDGNLYSRMAPMSVGHNVIEGIYPTQARAVDHDDIARILDWQRAATKLAVQAGFQVIYVRADFGASLASEFASRATNTRTDEYGGSLENRLRFMRQMLEATREAGGPGIAVATRFSLDMPYDGTGASDPDEIMDCIRMMDPYVDLWDLNICNWDEDSMPSRFGEEGHQEELLTRIRKATSKPVAGVGRFTSADLMVSQVKRGAMDLIGAARPSIADPFIPNKISEGRIEDIRECIGCNMCVTGDFLSVPSRCTQNPTFGEEWRRGWHPEQVPDKASDDNILIVGGGPAGLECALTLGRRGYNVTLAEGGTELGGRVSAEAALPGFGAWGRVRDYRTYQLSQMPNVDVYLDSALDAEQILEFGFERVVLATGAIWDSAATGRLAHAPWQVGDGVAVLTPDDVTRGAKITGPVLVYDDDHYYMASAVAQKLRDAGHEVTIVTPASDVSAFSENTLEQGWIERRLHESGVAIVEKHQLVSLADGKAQIAHIQSERGQEIAAQSAVIVTARKPRDTLYDDLMADPEKLVEAGITSVTRIGDCEVPSTIAAAVYSGHRVARRIEDFDPYALDFLREDVEGADDYAPN